MNMKWNILRLTLSVSAVLASISPIMAEPNLQSVQVQSLSETDPFYKYLLEQVHTTVNYNQNIPNKEEIHQLLEQLETSQYVSQTGSNDLRTKFFLAQSCIEHVLCCSQILGEISNLTGVVHMPMPPPPLCADLEDPSLGDPLDVTIAMDEDKMHTLRSRNQMIRDYLAREGVLFVTYPKSGLNFITPDQKSNYSNSLAKYSNVLFDFPLESNSMDPDLIGATYAFKYKNQWFVFSMKARQARSPQENSEWALWFGKINQPVIMKRVNDVCEYLLLNQGPNLKQFILKGQK